MDLSLTNQKQDEILRFLGRIEEKLGSVDARLDTLNGKVAGHEARFNADAIHDAEERGRRLAHSTWIDRLSPLAKFVLALLGILALQNGPALLKLFSH